MITCHWYINTPRYPYHVTKKTHFGTNDPPSLSYGQLFPEIITPTQHYTPHNNPPKLLTYLPIDPDSDPSSSDYSSLDSSDSSVSKYSKQGKIA